MMRRHFLAGILALTLTGLAGAAHAGDPAHPRVALTTAKGTIVIELEAKKAPITTANFLKYVDGHKYDGATFWRAANSGASGFIQASPVGPTFPPIKHESTTQTGLSHTDGTISMSRFAVGTATGDFVLCVGDNTFMDAGPNSGSDDHQGYAAFGRVVKGMNVVNAILHGHIAKGKAKQGGWTGQMLAVPVKIISAKQV
jgi:peptidyl-prolyl cis-trans isomerase A (cyclophilin A)